MNPIILISFFISVSFSVTLNSLADRYTLDQHNISQNLIPHLVTLDKNGNAFVVYSHNGREAAEIIKVSPNGDTSAVAGTNYYGGHNENVSALEQQIYRPIDVKILDDGSVLYFQENGRVYKINPFTQKVVHIAGESYQSGEYLRDGINPLKAEFINLKGVAIDLSGNLFLATNDAVWMIPKDSTVLRHIAGNVIGQGNSQSSIALEMPFNSISSIEVSVNNQLFINEHNKIHRVNLKTGSIELMALVNVDRSSMGADGKLYFMNSTFKIFSLDPETKIIEAFLGDNSKVEADGEDFLNSSFSVFDFDMSDSNSIWLLGNTLRKVDLTSSKIRTISGDTKRSGFNIENISLDSPMGVTVDQDGNLFIVDNKNDLVRKVNLESGMTTTALGGGTSKEGKMYYESSLIDGSKIALGINGDYFVNDLFYDYIRKIDGTTGIVSVVAGNRTEGYNGDGGLATESELNNPAGMVIDSLGNLFIADYDNHRVRKVDIQTGIITTVAGTGESGFSGDGNTANLAQLSHPREIQINSEGELLILDYGNNRIRKVNQTGVISTIIGNENSQSSGDGLTADLASLKWPISFHLMYNGDLLIADSSGYLLRRVDQESNIISKIAGGGVNNPGDGGNPLNGQFYAIRSITSSVNGEQIYLADVYNNQVRTIDYRDEISFNVNLEDTVSILDSTLIDSSGSVAGVEVKVLDNFKCHVSNGYIVADNAGVCRVHFSRTADSIYQGFQLIQPIVIKPWEITIVANDTNRFYLDSNPEFTYQQIGRDPFPGFELLGLNLTSDNFDIIGEFSIFVEISKQPNVIFTTERGTLTVNDFLVSTDSNHNVSMKEGVDAIIVDIKGEVIKHFENTSKKEVYVEFSKYPFRKYLLLINIE